MTEQTGDPRATSRPASQAEAWYEVTGLDADTSRLRIGGLFRTAWMAALCNQLARHRLSIDRAHARLAQKDTWIAELHLVSLPGAADPTDLAYVDLIESDDAAPMAALALERYELVESADHGGTLRLTIEAEDALGLLGSLLDALARIELFPIEVHIETRAGRAHDCLWLAAAGRTPPTVEARDALRRVLAGSARLAARG
jgi:hypothetical protein